MIKNLLSKNKGILIGTPKNPSSQKDVFENIFEIHKSLWEKKERSKFGKCYFIQDNISHIVYITKDEQLLKDSEKIDSIKNV